MKILVTGGCGFIGSAFMKVMLDNPKMEIINIDKISYCANKNVCEQYKERYELIEGDINNVFELLKNRENEIDYIYHFAAESHVDNSISGPYPFIHSNITGTFNMLEYAKKYDKPILIVSTDEVYGSLSTYSPPSTEEDLLKPSSVYSSSKASADLLALSYFRTFGTKAMITRCCNNYGANQYKEKFIPTILNSLKNNKKIPVYGDGKNTREWINVLDHCEAVWEVSQKGHFGEIYNIGSGYERSNIDLVRKVVNLWGADDSSINFVEDRKGHDIRYRIDSSKIQSKIGWKPKHTNMDEFLKLMVDDYKKSN
jgi:dTDP-glucose 4,6-dehydratase